MLYRDASLLGLGIFVGCAASAGVTWVLWLKSFKSRKPHPVSFVKSNSMTPFETKNPHEEWVPGEKQFPDHNQEFLSLDPEELTSSGTYPLVISAVVPRPIAFVSTLSNQGVGNLAPFSYFNVISHDPPCVVISVCTSGARKGGYKDTAQNILDTGEFCVNIISEWFVEAANHTCGNYDPDVNEMDLSGLTPEPSIKIEPPRVKESAFHMECKLIHTYDIFTKKGKRHTTVFIGEVLQFHVHKGVAGKSASGKVVLDVTKFLPISRLGGNTYGRTSTFFDLPRPDRNWQDVQR